MLPFLLAVFRWINNCMANFLSGFLDNLGQGLTNPKGNLGDFSHAARLYNSNAYRLAPKVKFLYHVVFNLNPTAVRSAVFDTQKHTTAVNMLVKQVDLPKFKMTMDAIQQYNRKKQVQTRIDYEPVNVVFHDDNVGLTTGLWSLYYGYYYADSKTPNAFQLSSLASTSEFGRFKYGLDNNSSEPFFSSIQIYQLSRHTYQCFTLVNPKISSWQHDQLDNSDSKTVQSTMGLVYEAVIYSQGLVSEDNPAGFATDYYDKQPSPLGILGGGTETLFGQGGVVSGVADVLGDILSGRTFSSVGGFLGTLIKGTNTYNNSKKLTSAGLRQEGFNILTGAIQATTGVNVSGVANVFFPKQNGNGQNQKTAASAPAENYTRQNQDTVNNFQTKALASPAAYANAITSIAVTANLAGVPKNTTDFNNLSSTQKTAAINTIKEQYESGNPKVVGLVNKFSNRV